MTKHALPSPANQRHDLLTDQPLVQRCIIVNKDDSGFGLTVSGDNPVFIQSVKQDGAAARSGVHQGDRIIKVNGTLVTGANHMEVVKLITEQPYVALTLLGKPDPGHDHYRHAELAKRTSDLLMCRMPSPLGGSSTGAPIQPPHSTSSRGFTAPPLQHASTPPFGQGLNYDPGSGLSTCVTSPLFAHDPPPDYHHHQPGGLGRNSSLDRTDRKWSGGGGGLDRLSPSLMALPNNYAQQQPSPNYRPSPLHVQSSSGLLDSLGLSGSGPFGALSHSPHSPGYSGTLAGSLISPPAPVDEEKQAEWRKKRVQIIYQMLDQERKHLEDLYETAAAAPSEKLARDIEQGEKRVRNLEHQAASIRTHGGGMATAVALQRAVYNDSPKPCLGPPSVDQKDQGGPDGFVDKCLSQHEDEGLLPCASGSSLGAAPLLRQHSQSSAVRSTSSVEFSTSSSQRNDKHMKSGFNYIPAGQIDMVVTTDEDDSDSDAETLTPLESHGPFRNFLDVKTRPAHLAVFLHYLISNSDPSSLLFYLLTDYYQQHQANAKDLRKWAYEIHSSFLVPGSPMRISTIKSEIIDEIDSTLILLNPEEESLKRVFVRARQVALDEINEHLADFRNKRTLGLGSVFGENELSNLVPGDRPRELRVVESLLVKHFDTYLGSPSSEFEQLSVRTQVLVSALATILRFLCVRFSSSQFEKLLDKCPCYVTKEKRFKLTKVASKKTFQARGHHLSLVPIFSFTVCMQCQDVIWGINAQGLHCSNCDMVVHRQCAGSIEDDCFSVAPGAHPRGSKPVGGNKRVTPSSVGRKPVIKSSDCGSQSVIREEPEDPNESEDADQMGELAESPAGKDWGVKSFSSDSGYGEIDRLATAAQAANVGRSQSMRTREDELRQSKRSIEGPGRRTKSDVDADDKSIALALTCKAPDSSGTSSGNVSIGAGSLADESPSSSVEHMKGAGADGQPAVYSAAARADIASTDSDLDIDNEHPSLEDWLGWEKLKNVKPKEKKRQEVILELFHTERSHVRNLKILCRVFYNPMLVQGILTPDIIKFLFANIEEILEIHLIIAEKVKKKIETPHLIGEIGDLMLEFLDGEAGERFLQATAVFCQHQQHALNFLRNRQRKDQKLFQFLNEAESLAICRKLQLKDMIPMEMQRLTKYPLLFESILKYTQENTVEYSKMERCLERSRAILEAVDSAKRHSENVRQLEELQKRLDTSPFDKAAETMDATEYKNLDLRKYRLIHDGPLQWRLGRNKAVDLHVVLLRGLLVFLTRTSDTRLTLRFHNINLSQASKEDVKDRDTKYTHCPILRITGLMPKNVATDKKAFFLVSTSSKVGPQIYELAANTAGEKKTWFKFLTDEVESERAAADALRLSLSGTAAAVPAEGSGAPLAPAEDAISTTESAGTGQSSSADFPTPSPLAGNHSSTGGRVGGIEGKDPAESEEPGPSTAKESIVSEPQSSEPPNAHPPVLVNPSQLINPCEVCVVQPTVYCHAEPILTPLEKLKLNHEAIVSRLVDTQKILAESYAFPVEELNKLGEASVYDLKSGREPRELVLSAVVHTNKLLESINESLRDRSEANAAGPLSPPLPPTSSAGLSGYSSPPATTSSASSPHVPPAVSCTRLTYIAAPLMKCLTQLLQTVQQQEEDVERLRKEVAYMKTQKGGVFSAEAADPTYKGYFSTGGTREVPPPVIYASDHDDDPDYSNAPGHLTGPGPGALSSSSSSSSTFSSNVGASYNPRNSLGAPLDDDAYASAGEEPMTGAEYVARCGGLLSGTATTSEETLVGTAAHTPISSRSPDVLTSKQNPLGRFEQAGKASNNDAAMKKDGFSAHSTSAVPPTHGSSKASAGRSGQFSESSTASRAVPPQTIVPPAASADNNFGSLSASLPTESFDSDVQRSHQKSKVASHPSLVVSTKSPKQHRQQRSNCHPAAPSNNLSTSESMSSLRSSSSTNSVSVASNEPPGPNPLVQSASADSKSCNRSNTSTNSAGGLGSSLQPPTSLSSSSICSTGSENSTEPSNRRPIPSSSPSASRRREPLSSSGSTGNVSQADILIPPTRIPLPNTGTGNGALPSGDASKGGSEAQSDACCRLNRNTVDRQQQPVASSRVANCISAVDSVTDATNVEFCNGSVAAIVNRETAEQGAHMVDNSSVNRSNSVISQNSVDGDSGAGNAPGGFAGGGGGRKGVERRRAKRIRNVGLVGPEDPRTTDSRRGSDASTPDEGCSRSSSIGVPEQSVS